MIKKGLKVKILSGKDRNKEGEVIEIDRRSNRAKIKGINIQQFHILRFIFHYLLKIEISYLVICHYMID